MYFLQEKNDFIILKVYKEHIFSLVMKIVIFTDCFLPQVNGVVNVVVNSAKGLADKGHKVYIIVPKYKGIKEFKYKNIKVIRVSAIPAFFYPGFKFTFLYSLKVYEILKNKKIDLIHFHVPMPLGFQAIIFSKIFKVPLVGTFHGFIADPQYMKHMIISGKYAQKLFWKYIFYFFNKCDLITTPSQSAKIEILNHDFHKPIKVISNGIDFKDFMGGNSNFVKKKYNLNKTVLFFGRIAHEKNVIYLFDGFKLILKKLPNIKLLVVGGGPQLKEFQEYTKEIGIGKSVIFTGMVNYKKLSSYIGACDLFATASTTETFGLTTIEAMANGLPVVAVNATGTKDIVKNGYNGYLVKIGNKKDFADKIIKLLINDSLRLKMGKNAFKEAKKYDNRKIVKIWEKEYKELIKT